MSGGYPSVANVISGTVFLLFLAGGLGVAWATARPAAGARARRVVSAFLAYTLAVSLYAGLKQRDGWPFSPWPIVAVMPLPEATVLHVVGVDAAGTEYEIDYRAWQPIGIDELVPWLFLKFPRLERPAQDRAAADLLERAEAARARVRGGRAPGYFQRFLGPFTAPYFLLHPHLWNHPADAPAHPLVALRLYNETWSLDGRPRPQTLRRDLSYEYRRP